MPEYKAKTLDELSRVAQRVALALGNHKWVALKGEMGAGKTTFIKALVYHLGSRDIVNSPTFGLVNEYLMSNGLLIYHFDFYRLKHPEEALDMGLEDYLYSGNYCLMEWPERVLEYLPEPLCWINIEVQDHLRTITYQIPSN